MATETVLEVGEPVVLSNTQRRRLRITGVDRLGREAPIEGITFNSDDPSIAFAELVSDGVDGGTFVDIVTMGVEGLASIEIEADAKIGEGRLPLLRQIDVRVTRDGAVELRIFKVGEPESRVIVIVPPTPEPLSPSSPSA